MKRHIPSLHALRAFEATARLLSFQQAAKELNVTHSAVSHQIKNLEEDLGQPLFERLGRTIALTEVGAAYVVEIREALNMIESSTYRIFGDPDKGDLSIQVYMGIASRWLVQRLGDFRDQYPDINIALYSSYFDWEFEPNAADIGIIYSETTTPGLMYQPLFKGMLIPVCSPDLIADNPNLTVMELLEKPFLRIKESPNNLPEWLKPLGIDESHINVVSERDNHQLALEAAIAGHGVAIVQSFFASGDIAGNRLVVPVDMKVPEIGAWYLVRPSRTLSDMKVNYFSNWLYRQIMADKTLLRAG
ncbi:LysR substrate-binding domain-containing protein [Pontibacterium granulatum]|uniref:LysR substrate-binding domain-containing protein n=1 Tax=Pontibacterium granulatum TaxID=2036029 RepID=UPI00249CAA85|nr:LysR substrate-binding domain-containing protein [Pontibacterium granulatum]MDI3324028.1 LysR substrate-binding domain-containing protein [Pontibacterium granulatum]